MKGIVDKVYVVFLVVDKTKLGFKRLACVFGESMNARVGDGSKLLTEPLTYVVVIDWIPTTRSRATSGARVKETFDGTYLETSEPPKVRLPKLPLDSDVRQHSPLINEVSYDNALLRYMTSSSLG